MLKKYSQLATNTIVFPNVVIGEGAVTGAMTLVNRSLEPWTVNIGIPVSRSRPRRQGLLQKARALGGQMTSGGGYKYIVESCGLSGCARRRVA